MEETFGSWNRQAGLYKVDEEHQSKCRREVEKWREDILSRAIKRVKVLGKDDGTFVKHQDSTTSKALN